VRVPALAFLLLSACGGNALRGTARLTGVDSAAGIQAELFFGATRVDSTTTSKSGAYSLKAPHKGLFALTLTPATAMEGPYHADVLVDGDSVAPDVTFTAAGTLSGGFTPAADCAAGTRVGYTVVSQDLSVHSDADGGFSLVAPVGTRNLEVDFDQQQGSLQYVDVPVGYGQTTPLIGLSPPAPTKFSSLEGWAEVLCDTVQNAPLQVRLTGPCDYAATTDAAGHYSFPSIRPGTYAIAFSPPGKTVQLGQGQSTLLTSYDVPFGAAVNAETRVWQGLGTIDGTAVYSDNRADKSGLVVSANNVLFSSATTDDSGFFSLTTLCGTWQLCVSGGTCATGTVPWNGTAHLAPTLMK
jgi:hypothetical protein